MAVGPDVHQAHQEDTERYVLTNLNMVRAPGSPGVGATCQQVLGASGTVQAGLWRGRGWLVRWCEI